MRRGAWAQILAGGACLLPALWLGVRLWTDRLGANPVEELTHSTGIWGLRLLLLSLAVTPLRQIGGLRRVAPYRRTLGLAAFFYACLHIGIWSVLDQGLELEFMLEDLLERPFITAGLTSFALLLPLAVTSTRGFIRRLGRRWTQLHRLVYLASVAAVIHFMWLVKADLREPLLYAAVLTALFAARWLRSARLRRPFAA